MSDEQNLKEMLDFLHTENHAQNVMANNGQILVFMGFYHDRSCASHRFMSQFRELGSPVEDPTYDYDVSLPYNEGRACWLMMVHDSDGEAMDFKVKSKKHFINAVSCYADIRY